MYLFLLQPLYTVFGIFFISLNVHPLLAINIGKVGYKVQFFFVCCAKELYIHFYTPPTMWSYTALPAILVLILPGKLMLCPNHRSTVQLILLPRTRGKVIGRGVYIYIYMSVVEKKI